MEQIVACLLMVEKFTNLKQTIVRLCLGNISKDWSVDNRKKMDLMVMFMTLISIMMLLQLLTYETFTILQLTLKLLLILFILIGI